MPAEGVQIQWLADDQRRGAFSFAALFALESFARALCASVISVQAFDLLQDNQKVATLFLVVGSGGLLATLTIPVIIGLSARRWVYSGGCCLLMLAAAFLATHTLAGQGAGMLTRVLGAACLNITLSLYILDHIRKQDLVKSEPLRLALSTASWTIGPYLGVYLYTHYGVRSPFLLSICAAAALLCLFWYLRLKENVIRAARTRPPNPLRNVGRFISQPRLRLAWVIAFGRSCFWSTFFTYVPLFMIAAGLGKDTGGLIVSLGQVSLASAIVFGKLAQKAGVRVVIAGAMATAAACSILAGAAGPSHPLIAAGFFLVGSTAAAALDGVGGIPFLRSLRGRERAEMAGVYRTYIDLSDLLPALVFSVVLLFLPIGSVFIVLGAWLAVVGALAWRYLPKSL